MKKSLFLIPLFVCVTCLASGCSRGVDSEPGDAPNLKAWVDQVNHRKTEPLEPLPTLTRFEPVPYNAALDRDPFSPQTMLDHTSTTALRPDDSRPKQALEEFALDSLQMVGTMGDGPRLNALVLAPDNVTYRIHVGEYMGQSDGRVVDIFEDHVDLVEVVSDGAGGWMERKAALSMEE